MGEYHGNGLDHEMYRILISLERAGAISSGSSANVSEIAWKDGVSPTDEQILLATDEGFICAPTWGTVYLKQRGRKLLRRFEKDHEDPNESRFQRWATWLAEVPEAADLFDRIVQSGAREFFTLTPMGGGVLIPPLGPGLTDPVLLRDLADEGLLRDIGVNNKGNPSFELPAVALLYVRWVEGRPAPLVRVERAITASIFDGTEPDGPGRRNVRNAFDMLTGSDLALSDNIITLGGHLRSAINETMSEVVGFPTENVSDLKKWADALQDPQSRHASAVVQLVNTTLIMCQGVHHYLDQQKHNRSTPTRDELEQACFLTAFACHELRRFTVGT